MMKKMNSIYRALSAKWKELLKILPLFFLYSIHCSDYKKCYESDELCATNSVKNLVFIKNEFKVKVFTNGEVHVDVSILNSNNLYRNRFFLKFNFYSKNNKRLFTIKTEEWTLVENGEDTFKCRLDMEEKDKKYAEEVKRHTVEIHEEKYISEIKRQYSKKYIGFFIGFLFFLVLLAYAIKKHEETYKKNNTPFMRDTTPKKK